LVQVFFQLLKTFSLPSGLHGLTRNLVSFELLVVFFPLDIKFHLFLTTLRIFLCLSLHNFDYGGGVAI
jgi:hypothetical protein